MTLDAVPAANEALFTAKDQHLADRIYELCQDGVLNGELAYLGGLLNLPSAPKVLWDCYHFVNDGGPANSTAIEALVSVAKEVLVDSRAIEWQTIFQPFEVKKPNGDHWFAAGIDTHQLEIVEPELADDWLTQPDTAVNFTERAKIGEQWYQFILEAGRAASWGKPAEDLKQVFMWAEPFKDYASAHCQAAAEIANIDQLSEKTEASQRQRAENIAKILQKLLKLEIAEIPEVALPEWQFLADTTPNLTDTTEQLPLTDWLEAQTLIDYNYRRISKRDGASSLPKLVNDRQWIGPATVDTLKWLPDELETGIELYS